jgi:hypothetical protein
MIWARSVRRFETVRAQKRECAAGRALAALGKILLAGDTRASQVRREGR